MKYSHRLSDAIHILAYVVVYADGDLSSAAIAQSVQANPSMVRRLMSRLVKAGLLNSQPGKVAVTLARAPEQISLRDVYVAVCDERDLLHVDDDTNPLCIVGGNIQGTLTEVYSDFQSKAEATLATYTLAQVIQDVLDRQKQKVNSK